MTISIDARQCGAGKTVDGIYKIIDNSYKLTPIVVVCGSIALQKQYLAKYPHMTLINSEYSYYGNTIRQLQNAMERFDDLICITHQTFMMINYLPNRSNYMLIIDEALNGLYTETKIMYTKIDYKWGYHFQLELPDDSYPTYEELVTLDSFPRDMFYNLRVLHSESLDDDNIISQCRNYRHITDRNYNHYITPYDYNIMMNHGSGSNSFIIYSLLNDKIFRSWNKIHVAAAAFEKSAMAYLFKHLNLDYNILMPFTKHVGNFKLHAFQNFKWSNNKRKNTPQYIKAYHDYVNGISSGPVLVLRNIGEKSKLRNEIELTHNVHGLNKPEYVNCTHISIESALVPSSVLKLFIRHVFLNDINDDALVDEAIMHIHCSYLFYQVIMRCRLRDKNYNNEEINLFTLDDDVMVSLFNYFEFDLEHCDEITSIIPMPEIEKKPRKPHKRQNPRNKQAMTSTERSRLHRDRKRRK